MQKTLLQLPHAEPQNYTEQVTDVLALIAGTYRSPEGEEAHVVPGEGPRTAALIAVVVLAAVPVIGSGWLLAAQAPRRYASRNSVNVTS
jgi:hypothetical protein